MILLERIIKEQKGWKNTIYDWIKEYDKKNITNLEFNTKQSSQMEGREKTERRREWGT